MAAHWDVLTALGFYPVTFEAQQIFKFGEGNPHLSRLRHAFAAGVANKGLILRGFSLPQPIPFLSSRQCHHELGMLLNGVTNTAVC